MPDKYGPHETATLFVLLLENREVPNPELKTDFKIDLRPTGRTKLNRAGLVDTRKDGRRLVHRITSAGVAWCESELVAGLEIPSRPSPMVRAVFEILPRLVAAARSRGLRLADLLAPTGDDGSPDKGTDAPADLETLIRAAYGELSVKAQDWVRLAKLRQKLDGAEKSEVDQVLLAMTRTGFVHLAPDSDRKTLTDADRAAAIRIGKEDKHLVAIEES